MNLKDIFGLRDLLFKSISNPPPPPECLVFGYQCCISGIVLALIPWRQSLIPKSKSWQRHTSVCVRAECAMHKRHLWPSRDTNGRWLGGGDSGRGQGPLERGDKPVALTRLHQSGQESRAGTFWVDHGHRHLSAKIFTQPGTQSTKSTHGKHRILTIYKWQCMYSLLCMPHYVMSCLCILYSQACLDLTRCLSINGCQKVPVAALRQILAYLMFPND